MRSWPQGYKTGVHIQTQAANHCVFFEFETVPQGQDIHSRVSFFDDAKCFYEQKWAGGYYLHFKYFQGKKH